MLHASEAPAVARVAAARERPAPQTETPLSKLVAGMIVVVSVLATTLISLCFLSAWLVTGHAIG
jgi:hypothetical protein